MNIDLNSTNICASHLTNPDRRDIFFLRYQTPPFIMADINRYYAPLLAYLEIKIPTFGDSTFKASGEIVTRRIPLCRLGVFKMILLHNTLSIILIPDVPTPVGASFTSLRPNEFFESYSASHEFLTFCNAIFKKVLFEQFIRQNVSAFENINAFEKIFSIDVFSNREVPKDQEMGYHIDADQHHIVSFFSLTYIIPPGVSIRGPIIAPIMPMPSHEGDIRPFLCVAVQNGTTIGVDNEAMIHSSPPTNIPNIPEPGTTYVMQSVQTHDPSNMFIQTRSVVNENAAIIHDTSTIRRAFIRLWEYKTPITGGIPLTSWQLLANPDFLSVFEAYRLFNDPQLTYTLEFNATQGNPTFLAFHAVIAAAKFNVGGGGSDDEAEDDDDDEDVNNSGKAPRTKIGKVPQENLAGNNNIDSILDPPGINLGEDFNDSPTDNAHELQQQCTNVDVNDLVNDPNKNMICYNNDASTLFEVDINEEGKDIPKKGGTQIKKHRKTRKNRNKNRKTKKYGNKNKKSKKNRSKKTKKNRNRK